MTDRPRFIASTYHKLDFQALIFDSADQSIDFWEHFYATDRSKFDIHEGAPLPSRYDKIDFVGHYPAVNYHKLDFTAPDVDYHSIDFHGTAIPNYHSIDFQNHPTSTTYHSLDIPRQPRSKINPNARVISFRWG